MTRMNVMCCVHPKLKPSFDVKCHRVASKSNCQFQFEGKISPFQGTGVHFCTTTHVSQFCKKFDYQGKKLREKYVEKYVDGFLKTS